MKNVLDALKHWDVFKGKNHQRLQKLNGRFVWTLLIWFWASTRANLNPRWHKPWSCLPKTRKDWVKLISRVKIIDQTLWFVWPNICGRPFFLFFIFSFWQLGLRERKQIVVPQHAFRIIWPMILQCFPSSDLLRWWLVIFFSE